MSSALPAIEERQIDGNYGEIYHNGHYQGDLRAITGTLAIEQQAIARAGTNTTVYRRGRITRSGGVTIGKVDSRFEAMLIGYANMSEDEKRHARGQGTPIFPDAQLLIKLDDPDSWGAEEIQLFGVKFWEIGLGFTPNSMTERDLPITWNSESLVHAIPRPGNLQGALATLPEGAITTFPAAGRDANPVI